ncbi:phospholipase D family protein [Capnocytophaga sp.]|uniref:phospholipase D family protein n=1 Tax=Capnocytophaga sp. TaxID=44737 RepID=UPI0026DBEBD8|nr:phospholipase D family protein [Capnocytophaga sp.]MDO5106177.1 phospholipase D family protein [Capnocytophaga sp.]
MATKIQILSNTNYSLIDVLKSELIESTQVKMAVAFVRRTGLNEIQKSLDYAMNVNNAKIELIAGLDFKTTDAKTLLALKEFEDNNKNFSFYCFGDKRDNYNDLIFHPKIYLFETELSKNTKYTSIIGSSNLTSGGLNSNFEVNTVFKEDKPKYFSQLQAIYNEIKFTDSVFKPSDEYIFKYGNIKKEIDKSKGYSNKEIQIEIQELKKEEQKLPGTIPSLKKIIIDFISVKNKNGVDTVSLEELYEKIPKIIQEKSIKMKMDTIFNTIRGELNKHEENSSHKDNQFLFKRVGRGIYKLTENAKKYIGR